ncbi:MAG: hypothetical protein FJ388_15955, partial [Verrucomicrobia bacterium]|nr:hypothetical protein [Verrucomicrobiota bacterium]
MMTDSDGKLQPVYPVWRGEGQYVLLLARDLKPGRDYYVYFGGGKIRRGETWQPRVSLLMETRRLPGGSRFETWGEMENLWRRATQVDGAGFVDRIFQGQNPFGDSVGFVTRFTGWLRTEGKKELFLYTQSCDASFVLVNDRFELDWAGVHDGRANMRTVRGQAVKVTGDLVKVDYYHVKSDSPQPPGMVLGWRQGGRFEPIPEEAWLRPEPAELVSVEQADGKLVPLARTTLKTHIGYGGQWLFEAECRMPFGDGRGWTANWTFDDGSTFANRLSVERILIGMNPARMTVRLQKGDEDVRGQRRVDFGRLPRQASINDPRDVERYV